MIPFFGNKNILFCLFSISSNHLETQLELKRLNSRLDDQELSINNAHGLIDDNKKVSIA